jgi:aminotransferase in exopolysaccharide biosynthesis
MERIDKIIEFIRSRFPNRDFIPLHSPYFGGNEKKYVNETIDSTFVSSVGEFVNLFERKLAEFTSSKYAIAIVNGTSALHTALLLFNVSNKDEILSQAITFIATANAISYVGATPIFIDVDMDTMGMSPTALNSFLERNAEKKADGFTYNKNTGRKISACIPMHTFGLPLRIDEIKDICLSWNISLIEDAAESIGSYYLGKHTGSFGKIGVFSFNGNKTITCGGGGALITDDEEIAKKAKHITTQAKVPHPWRFTHDQTAYNYRMPNLNAALACAQLEQLPKFLENKRELASQYEIFFKSLEIPFAKEINYAQSNYWLNAIILKDKQELEAFLIKTNHEKVMTRPMWDLMNTLPMFRNCEHDELMNSHWLQDRVVNIPSSVRL